MIEAEQALEEFRSSVGREVSDDKQRCGVPKWADIITLFDYPPAIRKAIYTTNAIESINSVIRKFTRNRKIYPNEDSALKMIYMAIREASQRVDDAGSALERGVEPLRHHVRGPLARTHQQITYPARLTQKSVQAPQ